MWSTEATDVPFLGVERLSLLLVDNNETDLRLMREATDTIDHPTLSILESMSMRSALDRLQSDPVDVCISEFDIGDGTALELFRAARNRNLNMPFIAITGLMDENAMAERLLAFGFDDVILKSDLMHANLFRIVRNAWLRAQYSRLLVERALQDELTGILNRRGILNRLNEELMRSRRLNLPISLVFADVNGFKALNDRYGHQHGDRALIHLAQVLSEHKSRSDAVGRMGGDEFVIVSPGSTSIMLDVLINRVLALLKQNPIDIEGTPVQLSVSMGGYTLSPHDPDMTVEEMLSIADTRMYADKKDGPNTTERRRHRG